jgi:hypothetical protein
LRDQKIWNLMSRIDLHALIEQTSYAAEPQENPFHPHVAENAAMRGTHDR